MKLVFLAAVCAMVAPVLSADSAVLILQKNIDTNTEYPQLFAEGRNFSVSLRIWNIGTGKAYDVEVKDDWPTDSFEVTSGKTSGEWKSIGVNEKVELNFTLSPLFDGEFPGFRAVVTYKSDPNEEAAQEGLSSNMPNIRAVSADVYDRVVASTNKEWTIFIVFWILAVAVPFAGYSYIQTNYENGIPKKKQA